MAKQSLSNAVQIQFGFRSLELEIPSTQALDLVTHAEQLSQIAAYITRVTCRFEELPGDMPGTTDFALEGAEFLSNLASALSGAAAAELGATRGT